MRLLLPLFLILMYTSANAQTVIDTVDRQTASRTDQWLDFSQSWEPTDSTDYAYRFDGQRDTVEQWQYDGETWTLTGRAHFRYRADGQEERATSLTLDPFGDTLDLTRTLFDYTQTGELRLVMNQEWEAGDWATVLRLTYAYAGSRVAAVNRESFRTDGQVNLERTEFTYDEAGNTTVELVKTLAGDSLQNSFRIRQIFEEDQLRQRFEEEWSFGSWLGRSRTDYTYLRSDTLHADTAVIYQWLAGNWRPFLRQRFEEDPAESRNSANYLEQWAGTDWIGLQRTLRDYDEQARWQAITFQQRTSDWMDVRRTLQQYNTRDQIIEVIRQDAAANGWRNSTRTLYWFESLFITTSTRQPKLTGVNLYPNPATESFTVELNATDATITQLQLYDMQGRLWLQQSFRSSTQQIHLPGHLPEGIYIVHLANANGRGSWPIVRKAP